MILFSTTFRGSPLPTRENPASPDIKSPLPSIYMTLFLSPGFSSRAHILSCWQETSIPGHQAFVHAVASTWNALRLGPSVHVKRNACRPVHESFLTPSPSPSPSSWRSLSVNLSAWHLLP